MKQGDAQNSEIRSRIQAALNEALDVRKISKEKAALLLQVELATLYKYLAGDMIPGGQVLWRACLHLGMILDLNGLRVNKVSRRPRQPVAEPKQYGFPFIDEQIIGKKVTGTVQKKGSEYVHVNLKIKVAG